jgi:hypothetical protein
MRNLSLSVEEGLSHDEKLWRYMDLSKFISLLSTEKLWLARPDTFTDSHEGKFPLAMKDSLDKIYAKLGPCPRTDINSAEDFGRVLCRNAYISCWHRNANENMVMWQIYGKDTNLVAIQTNVKSLKESLNDSKLNGLSFLLKNINYQNHSESKLENYTIPFFIKRPHFEFEKETRILLSTNLARTTSCETPLGHNCNIDTKTLIKEILVHPDSDEWFVNVIKEIASKYKIDAPVNRGLYGHK